MATDAAGNVVISGYTTGSLGRSNQGNLEAFVAKYSGDGKLLWKRQLGTPFEEQESTSVATDKDGNIAIAGTVGEYGCGECLHAFVARYAASGKLLWKRRLDTATLGGPATDGANNVLIGGSTSGGAFLAKYSPSGMLLWNRRVGTAGYFSELGVATDKDSNVLISGVTEEDSAQSAFVAKYSASGKFLWKRRFGTLGRYDETNVWSVGTDPAGNVLIVGTTKGFRFGPTQGGYDAFVAKFSATGNLLWTRQLGTPDEDSAFDAATDVAGNVVIGGFTRGSFGGANQGDLDVFVVKLRP
ncbi:MAG: PQQ-binding-like beta-propeller repeat protein [Rhodospirillales bacterium]